ncbi:MAG: hypothetical protein J2P27_08930 [Actinobacteria bacterium]|nr:hypothetical protein [Actinomycetota bacterium]
MDELPDRVLRTLGGMGVVTSLASLSGADFTSVMLEIARRRAARETPSSVLRRYRGDRFVQPAETSWHRIRSAEDRLAAHLPSGTELVTLPPLAPLGTHAVLGPMSQDKVVTAMRACEVAADPTNALALEAAVRRRDAGPRGTVRLAAFQRVVRALLPTPGFLPHFSLLGLVTAGRDDGGHRFEREAVAEHVRSLAAGLAVQRTQLALTPMSPAGESIAAALPAVLADTPVEVITDRARASGRGYYRDLCFKVNVGVHEGWAEVGDGGFTDWTARLTASAKERLLISGVGIDRVVAVCPAD